MKRFNQAVGWGLFLLLAGVFLLLWNLSVLDPWGDLAWGALYALAGLGFLIWFAFGVGHWWRAIPAFTLLSIGAVILLETRGIDLGEWRAPIVLFGMALGFWAILVVRQENWWALLPAGVLTTVGVLFALWSRLTPVGRLAVLYIGIGLAFLLLYAIRYDERDARWASIPAGALLLLGAVTLASALQPPAVLADWWPIALVVVGLVLIIAGFVVRKPAAVAPAPAAGGAYGGGFGGGGFGELPPAPGASVMTDLPAAPAPSAPGAGEGDIDIYKLIKDQP